MILRELIQLNLLSLRSRKLNIEKKWLEVKKNVELYTDLDSDIVDEEVENVKGKVHKGCGEG